jgi:hypothetical protein
MKLVRNITMATLTNGNGVDGIAAAFIKVLPQLQQSRVICMREYGLLLLCFLKLVNHNVECWNYLMDSRREFRREKLLELMKWE